MYSRGILILSLAFLFSLFVIFSGCQNNETFHQHLSTEFFVQDYHPEFLDVLWVIDDRSPLNYPLARAKLIPEAKKFFVLLDGSANQYRMAFISGDMQTNYGQGKLKPTANPKILTKNLGSLDEKVAQFENIFTQIINVQTGAENRSFEAALVALKSTFISEKNVPLVIVFIADSDEHSTQTLDYFQNAYRSLKSDGNQFRAYSINYFPKTVDERNEDNRCATRYTAEIDVSTSFQDRFFSLANLMGGDIGELCNSFSDSINLSGLRLSDPKMAFTLKGSPNPQSIKVIVYRGAEKFDLKWTFVESERSVFFETPPPEGSTIEVLYQ